MHPHSYWWYKLASRRPRNLAVIVKLLFEALTVSWLLPCSITWLLEEKTMSIWDLVITESSVASTKISGSHSVFLNIIIHSDKLVEDKQFVNGNSTPRWYSRKFLVGVRNLYPISDQNLWFSTPNIRFERKLDTLLESSKVSVGLLMCPQLAKTEWFSFA